MPPDPLEVCTFGAPLGSWSVFILDPRLMIIHYTSKQTKMKFKPRIKLNYNIYTVFYKQTLVIANITLSRGYSVRQHCNILGFWVQNFGKKRPKILFDRSSLKKMFLRSAKAGRGIAGNFRPPNGKGIRNWFEARRKNGRIVGSCLLWVMSTIELVLVLDGSL